MADFDPYSCPVGVGNEKSITYVGEKLDMAIARLEEKMEDMKTDLTNQMDSGFSSMNEKLDKVDKRLTTLENGLDEKIEGKVKQLHNNIVLKIVAWVFGTCGLSVVISLVSKYAANLLHLS